MTTQKNISVVIPVYNRADTIIRAVNSALMQTYPVYEVIVVDDCSTDDTAVLVEAVNDCRVRVIRNSINSGACKSRNIGIEASSGNFIALLDSDDEWLPGKLEKQVDALDACGADVCVCRFKRIFTETTAVIEDPREVLPTTPFGFLPRETLVKNSIVSTQTILAKREVFESCPFDDSMPRLQDYEWSIRTSENFSFYLVDDALVNVYLQDDSITSTGARKLCAAFEMILNKFGDSFASEPVLLSYLYVNMGRALSGAGNNPTSCYKTALKLHFDPRVAVKLLLAKFGMYR